MKKYYLCTFQSSTGQRHKEVLAQDEMKDYQAYKKFKIVRRASRAEIDNEVGREKLNRRKAAYRAQ